MTAGRWLLGRGTACLVLLAVLGAVGAGSASAEVAAPAFEVQEYREDFDASATEAKANLSTQEAGAEADVAGALEARLGSRFAGVWFDNESGEFVVPVLGAVGREKASDQFDSIDLGDSYRTVRVDSSWQELEAAQESLNQALSSYMLEGLAETSIDPRTNAVVVNVAQGLDAVVKRAQDLALAAKVQVEVKSALADRFDSEPAACHGDVIGIACDAPLRGGVGIAEYSGEEQTGGGGSCSAGFKALGNGTGDRYVVTAGHCVIEDGVILKKWIAYDHNNVGHYLGSVQAASWGTGNDFASIKVNGSEYWDVTPWLSMVVEKDPTTNQITNSEHPITSEAHSFVGEYACHTGDTSGTSCGYVKAMNISSSVEENPGEVIPVNHLSELYPVCIEGGDSGGPVYAVHAALGITSLMNGYLPECQNYDRYAEITEATDSLGVTVGPRTDTQTWIDSVGALNGNPGWFSIKGHVFAPSTVNNAHVNVKLFKWESESWVQKATLEAPVVNGAYEVSNWKGVGPGGWLAKVVFPAQNGLGESSSDEVHEGSFTVKDGYRIVNKNSGKCLDVPGSNKENITAIDQWECADPMTALNQVFTLAPQGNYVQVIARHSGRCLEVANESQADGATVGQWTCKTSNNDSQLWQVVTSGEYSELRAKHSGKCLDVNGGSQLNNATIVQATCNGSAHQKWSFQSVDSGPIAIDGSITLDEVLNGQPGYVSVHGTFKAGAYGLGGRSINLNYQKETAPNSWTTMSTAHPVLSSEGGWSYPNMGVGVGNWRVRAVLPAEAPFAESLSPYKSFTVKSGYRFVFRHSSKCMGLSANNPANLTPIIQWACSATPSPGDGQVFTLVPQGGGFFEIKINSTGKCVGVNGASMSDLAQLLEYPCAGAANELFEVIPIAGQEGWFAFRVKHSGKCANVSGASQANGATIVQYTCNWAGNQQWAFQSIS